MHADLTATPILAITTPQEAGFSSEGLDAIAAHFQATVDAGALPNAAFAISRGGRVIYRHHLGFADLLSRRPVTEDSIYCLLSLTKAVTGVAALTLLEAGLIALDDPIARYLPEFSAMTVWTPNGCVPAQRQITILDLLTHSSGLTSGFMPGPVSDLYIEARIQEGTREAQQPSLEDYVRKLAAMPLVAHPGAEWNYAEGLAVIGRLVEVTTGKRYGDYLQDRVFGPLGMRDCGFYVPRDSQPRLVSLYGHDVQRGLYPYNIMDFPRVGGAPMHSIDVLQRPGADLGGAGLVGTVDDVLRFAMMLAGQGRLEGVRILTTESVRLLTTGRTRASIGPAAMTKLPFFERGLGMDMGLGVTVITDAVQADSAAPPGSFGFGGSAGTRFWVDPDHEIAGVFFTQRMSCPPEPFSDFQRLVYAALRG